MSRGDLERLSKDELIELVLKLQRPAKTSRTSSKPPSTDRKERREQSRPGGAKPGHEGHSRVVAEDPDTVVDHRPTACPDCGLALSADLPADTVSVHEHIELPKVKPLVAQHRRLAVVCPGCRARVAAPRPEDAAASPFGPRLHATAVYLKTFQALSYERLQKALSDLFGLRISQGGLTKMLRRAEKRFDAGREAALSALRRATVVASDETGVRIEGTNSYHWVFRCEEAVVHHAAPTRGACVVQEIMDGHRPAVWLSDRYSAQQGHADRQQTCLAHLARDVAYALDAFAHERGLRIAARYTEHESGAKLKRPELFRLLADCQAEDVLLIEQVDRLSRLTETDWRQLRAEIDAKRVRIVALDLPTSWSLARADDEFTGRMLSAVNGMLLDMLAAVARKDYDDRRRRQAEGQTKAKAAGLYKGRQEDRKRDDGIAAMLRAGSSWRQIQNAFRCSSSTVGRVKQRLDAERAGRVT